MDDLKKYFLNKDTMYVIDYKNSSLKGKKLLTYLSNLEIPSDIDFSNCSEDEFKEVFTDYLSTEMICNIGSLERVTIDVIKHIKKLIKVDGFDSLISGNEELLDKWISKLDSLTIFNMYMIDSDEFKDYARSFPVDETNSLDGINFVSLLKHPEFYDTYQVIDEKNIKFYSRYFDDYMFKGNNLFTYWANENNIMFLLTYSISSGQLDVDGYIQAQSFDIKELENASSV